MKLTHFLSVGCFLVCIENLDSYTVKFSKFELASNTNTGSESDGLGKTHLACALQCKLGSHCTNFSVETNSNTCWLNSIIASSGIGNRITYQLVTKATCAEDWHEFENHCYYVSETMETWYTASDICTSLDAYLVTIRSSLEQEWVDDLRNDERIWIGGNDIDGEVRAWANGEPWDFGYFATDEPNGGLMENCYQMLTDQDSRWNDVSCGQITQAFVCERFM